MNYIEEAEKYLKHHNDLYRSLRNMHRERAKLIGKGGPKFYKEADYTQPVVTGGLGQEEAYNLLFKIKVLSDNIAKTEEKIKEIDIILEDISREPGCELYGDILKKWYIIKMPREEIAQEASYCERNIYKIKDKAIRKFAVNLFGLDAINIII